MFSVSVSKSSLEVLHGFHFPHQHNPQERARLTNCKLIVFNLVKNCHILKQKNTPLLVYIGLKLYVIDKGQDTDENFGSTSAKDCCTRTYTEISNATC